MTKEELTSYLKEITRYLLFILHSRGCYGACVDAGISIVVAGGISSGSFEDIGR